MEFLLLQVLSAQTQPPPPYRAPRFPGTQNPDLNGIWQAVNSANWDLEPHAAGPSPFPSLLGAIGAEPAGEGVVEGGKIPYQPWAAAKKKENFEKRFTRPTTHETNETVGDPEAKCYLPGVPRATYIGLPFQIIETSKQVLLSYEFASATRIVYMDRTPKAPAESWMGWSVGSWDGDTLVVDVTAQNDKTWFDRAGNFHSDDLHVVERYTPLTPYHLMYEATIEDPKVFTRPWKISMPLYRRMEPQIQALEFKCVEFSEEFLYGHLVAQPGKR
ncbi:MAG TPA: hypothetical protein VH640_03630 [Bryobacteraceae bacterium]